MCMPAFFITGLKIFPSDVHIKRLSIACAILPLKIFVMDRYQSFCYVKEGKNSSKDPENFDKVL